MTTHKKTSRNTRRAPGAKTNGTRQTTPRHVWLAVLGAAAVARRETLAGAEAALATATRLRSDACNFASDARDVARGAAMTVGEQIEPALARASGEFEARIAPVLSRFGFAQPTRATARKPRKAAARKKTTRRPAGARRKAAQRVARKGRA